MTDRIQDIVLGLWLQDETGYDVIRYCLDFQNKKDKNSIKIRQVLEFRCIGRISSWKLNTLLAIAEKIVENIPPEYRVIKENIEDAKT